MYENSTIAVIIPCYKASKHIAEVVSTVPDFVDHIIVVDDKCPDDSGGLAESTGRTGLVVVRNSRNLGVGGAVMAGYRKAMELGAEIMVKMDGDGQMDPEQMEKLLIPIVQGRADYTKGNRFSDFASLRKMPGPRLLGNGILSFMVKAASGYWDIMDPPNGYTAIHVRTLEKLDLEKISRRFFFESDILINLGIARAVVEDVGMPARYGDEKSTMNIWKVLIQFPFKVLTGLVKRVLLRYFVYEFNMASIYMLIGFPLLLFGVSFGIIKWAESISTGIPAPLGSIMLAALPIIVSLEMLLQAVNIDINSVPRKKR